MTAEGEQYTPEPLEMIELAMRECFGLISNESTPAHVKAKSIDAVPKLVAARQTIVAPPEVAQDAASVLDMLDRLPPERAVQLLDGKIAVVESDLHALHDRREALLQPKEVEA